MFALFPISQRIGDHATAERVSVDIPRDEIVVAAVQMPVHPEPCRREQVVQCIAESRRPGGHAESRIMTAQTGGEVRDDDGRSIVCLGQCGAQPLLTFEPEFADVLRQHGRAPAQRRVLAQIVVGRAERLLALAQSDREGRIGGRVR